MAYFEREPKVTAELFNNLSASCDPERGVQNRTPHEAFLAFAGVLKNEALTV